MSSLPITRASQLIQIGQALDGHGGSTRQVLAQAGCPGWYLEDPEALIPTRDIWTFMRMAARAVGNPALGHLVGARDPVASLGRALVTRLLDAATIYHELQVVCAHLDLQTSNMHTWLEDGGPEHVWFCAKARWEHDGLAAMEQSNVMQMVRFVRLGAGPEWKPEAVRLRVGRDPGVAETPLLSATRIHHRDPCTAIAVPRAILAMPLHHAHRWPASAVAEGGAQAVPEADDLIGSVRALVESWLPHGVLEIEVAAEAAGLQVRTLQRRLARDGTSFKQLVDRARFEAATRQLGDPVATITDIAFDLGYVDVAHFSRAFRRWAGVPPSTYRRYRMAS